jgi:hypothetical protein
VAAGDVADVDDVQAGRSDEPADAAARDPGDHAAGRSGLAVTVAGRGGRVDDDRAGGERQPFGCELRALVGDRKLRRRRPVELGRRPTSHGAARTGGARVHDTCDVVP